MCKIIRRIQSALRLIYALCALPLLADGAVTPAGADAAPPPRDTVRGAMQSRPGGPVTEIDARVAASPIRLTVVSADRAGLADEELVLGVAAGGTARAYPIRHLASNEVVGDRIGDLPVAATWCPLTGSGVAYLRRLDDRELTFDFVWGLVHDNLVITDRETGSVWSQLTGRAFAGPLAERSLTPLPSLQTTWAFWRARHPQTEVAIVPDAAGRSYVYFDPGGGVAAAMAASMGTEHDLSALGLGLRIGPIAGFFPLDALETASTPLRLDVAGTPVVLHYDREGMTAWAEDAEGRPLPGVLAYREGWKAFHPASRVFGPGAACGGPRE